MERTKSLEKHTMIISGKYKGLWSAYYVQIIFHNGKLSNEIKVNNGVRGINMHCEIEVDNEGWIYVD
jgi:hypothetical protein